MKAATKPALVDPIAGFKARCESRALLYCAGELTLHDAVDVLQQHAVDAGLVAKYGQDAVQKIMSDAFEIVRRPEVADRARR
jgi:hypothetical protein